MSQPIGPNTPARVAPTSSTGTPAATSRLDELRNPRLSPGEVTDARDQLGGLRSDPGLASMRRMAAGIALPPDQVADLQARVRSAANLPAAPADVPGKRAWVQQHAPTVGRAQDAASELQSEAFFVNPALEADADAARQVSQKARDQLVRVEEQAGLRRPVPPLDPTRPLGSARKALASDDSPGNIVGKLLTPLAAVIDVADFATRPLQFAGYPQAKQDYEARLAEYEKARREFPLP